jgi:hypothetical protein
VLSLPALTTVTASGGGGGGGVTGDAKPAITPDGSVGGGGGGGGGNTNPTYQYVNALSGGSVDLPSITQLTYVDLEADGPGSVLNLPALTSVSYADQSGGALQVTNQGTLTAPNLTSLNNCDLTLDGTGTWLSAGQLASFTSGTLSLSGGTLALTGVTDADSSVFFVGGGATLELTGLTYVFGANFQASGGATLELTGLTDTDWSTFVVGGGATLSLPANLSPTSFLEYTSTITLDGGTVNFFGTSFSMPAAGAGAVIDVPPLPGGIPIDLDPPGPFTGGTTFNVAQGDTVIVGGLYAGGMTFTAGTTFNVAQGGAVSLDSGTFTGGANFDVSQGATVDLTGGGSPVYAGTLTGSGGGTVQLGSGRLYIGVGGMTLDFPGSMFQWNGGVIDGGSGNLTNLGTVNLSGQVAEDFYNDGTFDNFGTIIQTGAGNLCLGTDNIYPTTLDIEPGAFYLIESDSGISPVEDHLGTTAQPTIVNEGTIRKTAGFGTSVLDIDGPVSNTGTIEVDSGALWLENASLAQVSGNTLTGGTWNAIGGATLEFPAATNIASNAANVTLSGAGAAIYGLSGLAANSGSFSLTGGASFTAAADFNNSGTLTVGVGSTLHVSGNFTQTPGATLNEQIGGTPGSGRFGRIAVAGTASLAGDIAIDLASGFTPSVGQSFVVMSFAGSSGNFIATENSGAFNEVLNPTDLELDVLAPTADLAASTVAAPSAATIGQDLTVTWHVTNQGVADATGNWQDAVYLSSTPTLSPSATLLGITPHSGPLAAGDSYDGSLTAAFPALLGQFYVIVHVDNNQQVAGSNPADTIAVAANSLQSDAQELPLGSPSSGTLTQGQAIYYRVDTLAGQDTEINLSSDTASAINELYASFRNLPTRGSFTFAYTNPTAANQEILIPADSVADTYYVMIYGRESSATQNYSISAVVPAFSVAGVDLPQAGNAGTVTFKISGAGFDSAASFQLTDAQGKVYNATQQVLLDSTSALATFDLTGAAPGAAGITVTDGGASLTVADATTIVAGASGKLSLDLIAPGAVRGDHLGIWTVQYSNTGLTDLPVPVLLFALPGAEFLSTSPTGDNLGDYVSLLGIPQGDFYDTLRPGESGQMTFYATLSGSGQALLTAVDPNAPVLSQISLSNAPADLGTNYAQLFAALQSQLADLALGPVRYHGVTCVNSLWDLGSMPSPTGTPVLEGSPPGGASNNPASGAGSADPADSAGGPATQVFIVASSNYSVANQTAAQPFSYLSSATDALKMANYCADTLQIPPANIHVILDDSSSYAKSVLTDGGFNVSTDCSFSGFVSAVTNAGIKPGDNVLVYQDGHGAPDGSYIFSDGSKMSPADEAAVVGVQDPGQVYYIREQCYAGANNGPLYAPNSFVADAADATHSAAGDDNGGYFTNAILSYNPGKDVSWVSAVVLAGQDMTQNQNPWAQYQQHPQAFLGADSSASTQTNPLSPWTNFEQSPDNDWNIDWSGWNESIQQIIDAVDGGFGPSVAPFTPVIDSEDPNNLVGPAGYGASNYITGTSGLGYTINFENSPAATAAAQTVGISAAIDTSLDPSSVRLGSFGFGSTFVTVPQGQTYYQTQLDLTSTYGVDVDVTAAVNVADATISWEFTSIDPATGLPTANPLQGFLPPDNSSGSGEGFVTFYVQPQANLPSNTAISEQASVVFDTNPAIATNVYTNTIDSGAPTSTVGSLPAYSPSAFTVTWGGQDDGSGIASYTVYVSDNGGTPTLWQDATTATSAVFDGTNGHTYAFSVQATDNVGNQQPQPSPAVSTTVDTLPPTSSVQPLPNTEPSASFTVSWNGQDNPGGSGIASYDVFVSDNGGSFQPWLMNTTDTSATYAGQMGHTYGFYSIATDDAGNSEVKTPATEASTLVASNLPTALLLTSDHPSGSLYGQTVTLTATVSPVLLGAAAPVGTVMFLDGTVTLGTGTWNPAASDFTYSTSTLALGSHAITAMFTPTDATALFASGGGLTQAVGQVATTTSIAASPDPAAVGQSVDFTVTVAAVDPSLGAPAGTVTVKDGGAELGTGTLASDGTFTCSASFKKTGLHAITASYAPAVVSTKAPKTNFLASGASLIEQVGASTAVPTTLQMNPSASPSAVGQVSFTVSVASSSGAPAGTVTLAEGKTSLGSGTLSGGAVTIPVSLTKVALHTIVATYSPAAGTPYSASTATFNQPVSLNASTTVVTASADPAVFGQSVTFTATVTGSGAGTPSGSITFMDGTKALGKAVSLTAGVATFTTSTLAVASHAITAIYKGDANFSASSGGLAEVVNQDATTTVVTSSLNPSTHGQKVTFTATVTPVGPGSGVPSGTVTFLDNGTALGNPVKLDKTGTAALKNISTLTVGSHTITAVYSGDKNFTASTSAGTGIVTQVVNAPVHTVLVSSPSAAAAAGQAGTGPASLVVSSSSVTPAGHLPAAPASHSSSFILSPSSLVLPASSVPYSDTAVLDHTGGQPAGDAMPRVAALRTAASGEARDEVLLRFAGARAGNASAPAGNQYPATPFFSLDLQTLDLLAGAATKRP